MGSGHGEARAENPIFHLRPPLPPLGHVPSCHRAVPSQEVQSGACLSQTLFLSKLLSCFVLRLYEKHTY